MKRKVMNSRKPLPNLSVEDRALSIDEIRLVSDLRIMHAKVDELFQIVSNLQRRHRLNAIHKYADQEVLSDDIQRVDDIYLWFVNLKDSSRRKAFAVKK
jgi:hypothetical protein